MKDLVDTRVEVEAAGLSNLLAISESQLRKLSVQGHVVRRAKGKKYDLWASVHAYVIHLRQRIHELRAGSSGHTSDLNTAKIKELVERSERLAMANAQTRGELVSVDDIMLAYSKFLGAARERILSCSLTQEEKVALMDDLRGLLEMQALTNVGSRNGHSKAGVDTDDAAIPELQGVGG